MLQCIQLLYQHVLVSKELMHFLVTICRPLRVLPAIPYVVVWPLREARSGLRPAPHTRMYAL
jgi:hypothetical protein